MAMIGAARAMNVLYYVCKETVRYARSTIAENGSRRRAYTDALVDEFYDLEVGAIRRCGSNSDDDGCRDLNNFGGASVLYLLQLDDGCIYKYGKTNNMQRRFGEHVLKFKEYGGHTIRAVKFWKVSNGDVVTELERKVGVMLKQAGLLRSNLIAKTDGGYLKEIFETNDVQAVIETIDSYVVGLGSSGGCDDEFKLRVVEAERSKFVVEKEKLALEIRKLELELEVLKLRSLLVSHTVN